MDITRDWFPPFWCSSRPLLQLTSVVVCLWSFLPLVLSSASECSSVGLSSGDWLGYCRILHFLPQKLLCCFAVCFGSSSINTMKRRPINFAPFDWIWAESWAVPSLLHTFFFPSFWYRFILISAVQRMLFQTCSGFFRCFLAKSNLAFFAPCGEPSVFALVKTSLDFRL